LRKHWVYSGGKETVARDECYRSYIYIYIYIPIYENNIMKLPKTVKKGGRGTWRVVRKGKYRWVK
jgi:hypothetical protein